MCQDRLGSNEVDLTHEFLSTMLGVQRSTVTLATHTLEGAHHIRARRGRIAILDREARLGIGDGSHGIAESEYERIIGSVSNLSAYVSSVACGKQIFLVRSNAKTCALRRISRDFARP
ncbi:helix-turn-helix domain-containing protein [Aurantimonas sp. VKM B-3413]|uniref:helix-turn-helix domain-containing protein n=1 Tax=Aurantimonas sp. VKM B-3413 TaxID=2779401 RepID=UPI001E434C8B|nr:helix-turn-helix domain-containing protein [Aurantimonas sp. VKM B-3413]MCB8839657.1 helix-turn-helix domain-containing protein [Aurantimonas sp. VKM B-3413]